MRVSKKETTGENEIEAPKNERSKGDTQKEC